MVTMMANVKRVGGELEIGFRYDPAVVEAIRQVPGRRFDRDRKLWVIPTSQASVAYKLLQEAGLELPELLEFVLKDDASSRRRSIARRYPGLYSHQVEGIDFLLRNTGAILADEMGMGKTRQAIIAAIERGGSVLVVCPASLKLNWRREIWMVDPQADVFIVQGNDYEAGHKWTVINYDILGRHRAVLSRTPWKTVVLDEAHFIKNESQRTRHVLGRKGQPGILAQAEAAYLLTGTPIMSRPRELFNLLRAIRHPLGRNWWHYAQRYCDAYLGDFGWVFDGASNLDELARLIAPVFLQRKKKDVLDLPEKLRTYMPVAIPRREYDKAEARFMATRELGDLMRAKHELARAKIGPACEHIDAVLEAGEKLVAFTNYNAVVDSLMERYGDMAVRLTGEDSQQERDRAVQRFRNEDAVRVFVGNLRAAGFGLNLEVASQVLFVDLDWVPAMHWQAEDRCLRIGQKRTVNVVYLVADGTIDDYIQEVLEGKTQIVGAVEKAVAEWLMARRKASKSHRQPARAVEDEF